MSWILYSIEEIEKDLWNPERLAGKSMWREWVETGSKENPVR